MRLSLIAAVGKNGVIGAGGKLPWKLPADLVHFKQVTMGHPIIMGRKTFESIGRALPGRVNIVVTRQRDYAAPGCVIAASLDEAFERAKEADEVFIIGGAELFRAALPRAEKLYLTRIDRDFEGDTFFPKLDPALWREVSRREGAVDEQNPYPHTFIELERRTSNGAVAKGNRR
jgi:dihydrofolate reductase